jgi:nucleolar protein 16
LNAPTGGTEKKANGAADNATSKRDSLAIAGVAPANLTTQEVQVEKDPETGRIIRVIRPEDQEENDNPLNDPLNDIMDFETKESTSKPSNDVIAQLEAQAAKEEELLAKKRPRQQSQREEEWISKLIEKHGDDIKSMVRDRKLNPMQQTEGDIARRLKKWKMSHSKAAS